MAPVAQPVTICTSLVGPFSRSSDFMNDSRASPQLKPTIDLFESRSERNFAEKKISTALSKRLIRTPKVAPMCVIQEQKPLMATSSKDDNAYRLTASKNKSGLSVWKSKSGGAHDANPSSPPSPPRRIIFPSLHQPSDVSSTLIKEDDCSGRSSNSSNGKTSTDTSSTVSLRSAAEKFRRARRQSLPKENSLPELPSLDSQEDSEIPKLSAFSVKNLVIPPFRGQAKPSIAEAPEVEEDPVDEPAKEEERAKPAAVTRLKPYHVHSSLPRYYPAVSEASLSPTSPLPSILRRPESRRWTAPQPIVTLSYSSSISNDSDIDSDNQGGLYQKTKSSVRIPSSINVGLRKCTRTTDRTSFSEESKYTDQSDCSIPSLVSVEDEDDVCDLKPSPPPVPRPKLLICRSRSEMTNQRHLQRKDPGVYSRHSSVDQQKNLSFDPHVWVCEFERSRQELDTTWFSISELEGFRREAIQLIQQRNRSLIPTGTGRVVSRTGPSRVKGLFTDPALSGDDIQDKEEDERVQKELNGQIRNILVVDPHDIFLKLFAKALRAMLPHVNIATAHSVKEAQERIAPSNGTFSREFDIVIVEERIEMPRSCRQGASGTHRPPITGSDLIRHIGRHHPRSLLIGVSAHLAQDEKHIKQSGADLIWPKPPPPMGAALSKQLLEMILAKRKR